MLSHTYFRYVKFLRKAMLKIKNLLESAQWYQRTRQRLVRDYGKDADLMADLIAATSAHTHIAINLALAKEVYRRYCLFENWEIIKGINKAHRLNIERALNRQPLSGCKVKAFAENLKGNLDEVTIDGYIVKYYNYTPYFTQHKLRQKAYDFLVSKVKRAAKRLGLKPAEYQAIIWVKARGIKNGVLSLFDGTED